MNVTSPKRPADRLVRDRRRQHRRRHRRGAGAAAEGGVAVAYFGDGAMNQGYFFECLNFCKVLGLPIVLVCENNGYGEYTAFEEVTAGAIRARAEVMEVPAETIDGMEVWTVREAAARAVEHARSGGGPQFVEAITYRYVGHSRSDPGKYRPEGELERWRERDPLVLLRARLEGEGVEAARSTSWRRRWSQLAEMSSAASPRRSPSRVVRGVRVSRELAMPKLSDSTRSR